MGGAEDMRLIVSKQDRASTPCNPEARSGVDLHDTMTARGGPEVRDEDFVEEIYLGSYRRLVGQLYLMCGDLGVAEDVVSEAFVRAVAHAGTFRRTDNPEAWLRRVAVNLHHSRWRRMKTYAGLRHRIPAAADAPGLDVEHLALMDALRALPDSQREAIVLHHLADRPVQEIATTLGVPVGTVKARLSRGRAALATALQTHEEEPRV
jgi:RNA polymerase sigma-70 factor, ECF subfamily